MKSEHTTDHYNNGDLFTKTPDGVADWLVDIFLPGLAIGLGSSAFSVSIMGAVWAISANILDVTLGLFLGVWFGMGTGAMVYGILALGKLANVRRRY